MACLLLALGTLSSACGPTGTVGTSAQDPTTGQGVVTWIVDGDTIEVEGNDGPRTLRLAGINAPDQGECYFTEATRHLIDTIKDKRVTFEALGLDQFDRTLAIVREGGNETNASMVELGLAIAVTAERREIEELQLEAAEERAFRSRTGLWAEDACGAAGTPASIIIRVDVPDPSGPDEDHLEDETVSLRNSGDIAIDLGGWVLRDESSVNRLRFEEGPTLPPGSELEVSSLDPRWEPGGRPVWNNSGDMALLLDDHGRVVARYRYP